MRALKNHVVLWAWLHNAVEGRTATSG